MVWRVLLTPPAFSSSSSQAADPLVTYKADPDISVNSGSELAKFTVRQITRYGAAIIRSAIHSSPVNQQRRRRAQLKTGLTANPKLGQEINRLFTCVKKMFNWSWGGGPSLTPAPQ